MVFGNALYSYEVKVSASADTPRDFASELNRRYDGGHNRFGYSIGESIKYATIVVATLPILCVYPFIQKYFVKGMMIGAVKG